MLIRNGIAVWSAREMNLRECYEYVRRIDPDLDIDAFEVAEEVSRLRQFWKPETVRVVLLAESHAYTSQKDFVDWEATDSPYHGKFVRLSIVWLTARTRWFRRQFLGTLEPRSFGKFFTAACTRSRQKRTSAPSCVQHPRRRGLGRKLSYFTV